MDLNKHVGNPCKRTSSWGFVGYLENGNAIPIGVYSSYRDGVAHANAWMKSTPNAEKWEGQCLYEDLEETDG